MCANQLEIKKGQFELWVHGEQLGLLLTAVASAHFLFWTIWFWTRAIVCGYLLA